MRITRARKRRGWRVLIPRHGTIVACLALVLATGGTAVAASSVTFLLGHANTEKATSGLASSGKGPALSLKTSSSTYAPMAVGSKQLVSNLNVSYLGGLAGSGLGGVESSSLPVPASSCHAGVPCTTDLWGPISGVSQGFGAQFAADTLTPGTPLVARDLSVSVTSAPGPGDSVTVIVSVDDADTAFSCQVAGGTTSCTDTSDAEQIMAGSRISLLVETTIAPRSSLPLESVAVAFRLEAERAGAG